MARLAGLEPATLGLEGRCSIQLSYRRIVNILAEDNPPSNREMLSEIETFLNDSPSTHLQRLAILRINQLAIFMCKNY